MMLQLMCQFEVQNLVLPLVCFWSNMSDNLYFYSCNAYIADADKLRDIRIQRYHLNFHHYNFCIYRYFAKT
jgi:hypothetical protein